MSTPHLFPLAYLRTIHLSLTLTFARFWILLLFLSPILSSILFQLYIFTSTSALVRTEGVLTQLVFEHALQIRMKEEAPTSSGTSVPNTPRTQTFDLPSVDGEGDAATTDGASTANGMEASASSTTAAGSASTTDEEEHQAKTKTTKTPPTPAAKPEGDDSSSGANLAGRINNLISTDLENITESRDFMFLLIYAPLQTALCIGFLYRILGWSSFVGMGVMIAGLWAPIQIGKITHGVQVKRMKAVSWLCHPDPYFC